MRGMKVNKKGYDSDLIDKRLNEITPEEFGIHMARYINEIKSSNLQTAVGFAFSFLDKEYSLGLEWYQIETLVKRIAELKITKGEFLDE